MKRLPIVLLIFAAGSFLAFRSLGTTNATPPGKYEKILKMVGELLTQGHFNPQDINDGFSKKVYKKFMDDLDREKTFFLQSDNDALKKFESKVDDEIKGSPVEFTPAAGQLFNKRMEEASVIVKEFLAKPFDFTADENVILDGDKLNYAANTAEIKERWRKKIKYMVLERYVDLQDNREKNKGVEGFVVKTDQELEAEARDRVKKLMDRTFERYRLKFSDDDKFNLYVNAITTTFDPHTEFFPPVDKRYFDEEMSGRFYGIGASLVYDEGNIKVNTLVSGSPAWKSGDVQVGDVVMKVAEGKAEPVELTGFSVTDAVKVIRGKKGTEVRLTLKKQDGTIKTVALIRDEIVQDETFARSAVINNNGYKVGFIYLPEFYADFENPNGNRSYVDVAKEIIKLKEEKVDGIVMDLRNNGGGYLNEVVQMAGLFINDGPIVQVKDRGSKPTQLNDRDRSVLYTGPLAVMVNEFSASASEIFAAAIQDYGRGVIIGSTSTYGKGTVQRHIGLDPENGFSSSNSELGTVKLTLQKYYRINGGSVQLKGVLSDIVLPDNLEYLKVREKDDEEALPWDEITKAHYLNTNSPFDLKALQQMSNQRLENNVSFKLIKENSEWLAKQNDKDYSLNIATYRKERKMISATIKQMESLMKLQGAELDVQALSSETNKYGEDKNKQERFNNWLKSLRKDIYLDQAVKVVNDMVKQEVLVKGKPPVEEKKKAF